MPITQTRVLRLIEAGERFRDRYEFLYHTILIKCKEIQTNQTDLPTAFNDITSLLTIVSREDLEASTILAEERTRHNLTHARNAAERLRMIRKRAQAKESIFNLVIKTATSTPTPNNVHIADNIDPLDAIESDGLFGEAKPIGEAKPKTPEPEYDPSEPTPEELEFWNKHR